MRGFNFTFILQVFILAMPFVCPAQTEMAGLRTHVEQTGRSIPQELPEFYDRLNYRSVWLADVARSRLSEFENMLKKCAGLGLEESDYISPGGTGFMKESMNLKNAEDSVLFEEKMSASLIRFIKDLFYGNRRPDLGYYGISYKPGCFDIAENIANAIRAKNLTQLITQSMYVSPEIVPICEKLQWLDHILSSEGFKEAKIVSKIVTNKNTPLAERLYQLGLLPKPYNGIPDTLLIRKLTTAQTLFGLLNDGVLRSTSLKELNVPLVQRRKQLETAVNYYRWLSCMKKESVVVVNIPEAYLRVWQKNILALEMRMIVGKPSTPTPALASTIDEVILYPFWHVPYSIATRELLPAIKRNVGVLESGNYQVINSRGQIVSPSSLNWRRLSANNFPYTIRQSTGCDNALGLLKLNFYSPFGVYLHDTPNPSYFLLKKRFLSHGCMRMEKPFDMGHLLMKNNSIAIDTLEQAGCLRNQSPVFVKVEMKMPVLVWYNPVGLDGNGQLVFFEDIYKRFHQNATIKK